MNDELYNKSVHSFKEKVKQQEKDIINGKIVIKDLNDFVNLHNEVNQVIDEYRELVQKSNNPKHIEELEAYLKEKLDYLDEISKLLNILNKNHDNIGVVDSNIIEKEWQDVRVLITYSHLNRSLEAIKVLKETNPDVDYANMEREIQEKIDSILNEVIKAEDAMIKRNEMDPSVSQTDNNIEKEEIEIDYEELKDMTLYEQISYYEKVLENIENLSGKKKHIQVEGKGIDINKKYASRYSHYCSELNNLYLAREEESKKLLDLYEQISEGLEKQIEEEKRRILSEGLEQLDRDEFIKLSVQLDSILYDIFDLFEDHNNLSSSKEDLIKVKYHGEKCLVLKSNINKYEELCAREKEIRSQLDDVAILNEEETVEDKQKEIIEKIQFLKYSDISEDDLDLQITALLTEYCKLVKKRKFTSSSSLIYLLQEQGFDKEDATNLVENALDFMELLKSKKINDTEKQSVIEYIKNAVRPLVEPKIVVEEELEEEQEIEEEEEISEAEEEDVNKLSKKEQFKNSFISLKDKGKNVAKEVYTNANKALAKFAKKGKGFVAKIKEVKKPKNIKLLQKSTMKQKYLLTSLLGLPVVLSFGNVINSNLDKKDVVTKPKTTTESDNINHDIDLSLDSDLNKIIFSDFNNKNSEKTFYDMFTSENFLTENEEKALNIFNELSEFNEEQEITEDLQDINDSIINYGIESAQNIIDNEIENTDTFDITDIQDSLTNSIDNYQNYGPDLADSLTSSGFDYTDVKEGKHFTINPGTPIYENMYDAAEEKNGLNPHYAADSDREITDIRYLYNGEEIKLDLNDPDIEAQIAALEANGAELIVLSEIDGIEGYYNIDDVNMEGRSR